MVQHFQFCNRVPQTYEIYEIGERMIVLASRGILKNGWDVLRADRGGRNPTRKVTVATV